MWSSFSYSVLFFFCLVGSSVYVNFLGGYYSGSKFSYLGSMRVLLQRLGFEVSFFFLILSYLFLMSCFEFNISGNLFLFPLSYPWFMSILVELGRSPVDFIEGERELVSGYNTEFSGVFFIFLFLSEYGFLL
jgi:NADH:ubiquinone oxidoreductase subunit H